jgi:hypothetical protein
MAKKEQNASSEEMDPCQVRSTALGAFERTHGRTQGGTVERRPSQPASHASWQLYAVERGVHGRTHIHQCVRTDYLRSNADQ